MAIKPYLTLLTSLRNDLADIMQDMGLEASHGEALQTLIPKLLNIPTVPESAAAALTNLTPSFGFYAYQDTVTLTGAATVTAMYKMASATLRITGPNVQNLTVTAPNWTAGQNGDTVTLTAVTTGKPRSWLVSALDGISLQYSGTEPAVYTVTLVLVGVSGTAYPVAGSIVIQFQGTSWAAIEAVPLTWAMAEDAAMTWTELENYGKPD